MKLAVILCVNIVFLLGGECGFLKELVGTVTGEIHKVKEDINDVIEYKKQIIKNTVDYIGTEAKEIHDGVRNMFKKKDKSKDKDKDIIITQTPSQVPENSSNITRPPENNPSNDPIVNSTTHPPPFIRNNSSDSTENQILEDLNPLIDIRSGNISPRKITPIENNQISSNKEGNMESNNGNTFIFSEQNESSKNLSLNQSRKNNIDSIDIDNNNNSKGFINENIVQDRVESNGSYQKENIKNNTPVTIESVLQTRNSKSNILKENTNLNTKDVIVFPGGTTINKISTTKPLTTTIIQDIRSEKVPNSEEFLFTDNMPKIYNEITSKNDVSKCPGDLIKAADGSCLKPVKINMNKDDMKNAYNITLDSRYIFDGVCPPGKGIANDGSCQTIIT